MKILLICKGEYRYFFPQVARALSAHHGCTVGVVAFSSAAARMLEKTGAFDDVFNLAAYLKSRIAGSDLQECIASLRAMERADGLTTLNMMIHADRIIGRYLFERAMRILAAVSEFWGELLQEMHPDAILGEIACATEWMAWSFAQRMNVNYLVPYPCPVAGRFFFLDSPNGVWASMERRFESAEEHGLSPDEIQIAEKFVRNFRARKVKPDFLSWAQRSPFLPDCGQLVRRAARIPFRLQTFLEDGSFEVGSYHGTPPWQPVWEDTMRIVRHATSEIAIFERRIEPGPKVYFPLHVQPEFTTDVRAPFFTNQVALVEGISKSVPAGCRVIVKEHPGMKGERRLGYYRALKKFYNVQLLSPSVDSHDVIRQSDVVLTITGTSAWEAILYEKPVIAFGPLCYAFGELVYRCKNIADLPAMLAEVTERFRPKHNQVLNFVWALLASAYQLEWGDPIRSPHITESSNVEKVANAIVSEISSRTLARHRAGMLEAVAQPTF